MPPSLLATSILNVAAPHLFASAIDDVAEIMAVPASARLTARCRKMATRCGAARLQDAGRTMIKHHGGFLRAHLFGAVELTARNEAATSTYSPCNMPIRLQVALRRSDICCNQQEANRARLVSACDRAAVSLSDGAGLFLPLALAVRPTNASIYDLRQ